MSWTPTRTFGILTTRQLAGLQQASEGRGSPISRVEAGFIAAIPGEYNYAKFFHLGCSSPHRGSPDGCIRQGVGSTPRVQRYWSVFYECTPVDFANRSLPANGLHSLNQAAEVAARHLA